MIFSIITVDTNT